MNNYWREREEEKIKLDDVLIDEQISKISLLMDDVISRIDTEISKLYLKYSKDNGVSYHEALVYLKDNERKEFQRDLKYYIDSCKNNDKLDKYRQELQALSTRARVRRLEVIQAKIRIGATDIESFLRHDNVKIMNNIYTENFLHSIFSIEGAKGIDIKFNMPNADKVEKLLQHPWSGKNYSQKIWDTAGNFVNKMDSILTTGLIQGKSYKAISRELELAKVGKTGSGGLKYQCERLVRTEAAFIAEQATKDSYEKYGVEEYEYSATLDLRTSEICSELDNKVFKVSEAITGVNYPPMHVHCRSTTVPIVKWEGEEDDEDIRIYRNPLTGENNFAKFKDYAEWKDEQYKKYGEDKVTAEQKKIRNKASDKLQFDKYKAVLEKKDLPGTFAEFQELKYNNIKKWKKIKNYFKYAYMLKDDTKFTSKYPIKKSTINWRDWLDVDLIDSNNLNDMHSNLNRFINTENREKMFLYNLVDKKVIGTLEGQNSDSIELSKDIIKLLKNSTENSIILAHNHPSPTTFSRYDIYQIIKYKSIKSLTLECANGKKYIIDKGEFKSSFLKKNNFPSRYENIYWRVASNYPELDDDVKRNEVWDNFLNDVTKEVAKEYGIIYKEIDN